MSTPIISAAAVAASQKVGQISIDTIQKKSGAIYDKYKIWLSARNFKNEQFFYSYFAEKANIIGKIKTLLDRNIPVNIESIYVPTKLRYSTIAGEKICDGNNLYEFIEEPFHITISALGGAGKSTFCKHLFLKCVEHGEFIPIFLEMRKIAQRDMSISEGIIEELNDSGLSRSAIPQFLLKKAKSIIILDGWDEIPVEKKRTYSLEASKLINSSLTAKFIISSRPDEALDSWPNTFRGKILPMEQAETLLLLQKMNYDKSSIADFTQKIATERYAEYAHLLSNPLLLTIMVLTFSVSGEIPAKNYLFYQQAFDALFYKHDTSKEGYKRVTETKLPEDEFKRLTAGFALVSYIKETPSFSREDAIRYAKKAITHNGQTVKPEAFIEDLKTAVCILQQDGLQYAFVHKTFQEYFAAYQLYVTRSKKDAVVNTVINRASYDQVKDFLYEMSPEYFAETFICPTLLPLHEMMRQLKKTGSWELEIFHQFLGEVEIKLHSKRYSVAMTNTEKSNKYGFCMWLLHKCSHPIDEIDFGMEEAISILESYKFKPGPITNLDAKVRKALRISGLTKHLRNFFIVLDKKYVSSKAMLERPDIIDDDIL